MSDEMVLKYHRAFSTLDANHDGMISLQDLVISYGSMGMNYTKEDLELALAEFRLSAEDMSISDRIDAMKKPGAGKPVSFLEFCKSINEQKMSWERAGVYGDSYKVLTKGGSETDGARVKAVAGLMGEQFTDADANEMAKLLHNPGAFNRALGVRSAASAPPRANVTAAPAARPNPFGRPPNPFGRPPSAMSGRPPNPMVAALAGGGGGGGRGPPRPKLPFLAALGGGGDGGGAPSGPPRPPRPALPFLAGIAKK